MADRNLSQMSTAQRAQFRAASIGFVFQMFHLLPYFDLDIIEFIQGGELFQVFQQPFRAPLVVQWRRVDHLSPPEGAVGGY